MWGWKAIETKIDTSVSLEQAKEILEEAGFKERNVNPEYVFFKRKGTQFALKGEKMPIELFIGNTDAGMFLKLRYDSFVLFDTGDLAQIADDLVSKLSV